MFFSTYFRALSAGKKTAFVAVLAALSVVVNCFSIDIGASNKIAFTYTVCFFAGYLLGGVPAFFVALFGDVIGYLVNSVGVYWLYGVTLGLYAFLMGVVMNVPLGKGHRAAPYIKAAAALLLGYALVTVFLNSLINYSYLMVFVWNGAPTKTFLVYLGGRLAFQTIVYAVNFAICVVLLPVLVHIGRTGSKNRKTPPAEGEGERVRPGVHDRPDNP